MQAKKAHVKPIVKKTKPKKARRVKLLMSLGGLGVASAVVVAIVASCSSPEAGADDMQFVTKSSGDPLSGTSTPLNPTFTVAPNDSIAGSTYVNLVSYETRGEVKVDKDLIPTQVSEKSLILEGATKVTAYKKKSTTTETTTPTPTTTTTSNSTDEYEEIASFTKEAFNNNNNDLVTGAWKKPDGTTTTYLDVVQNAVKYSFTIDTDIKWHTANGSVAKDQDGKEISLSGKDFERSWETYGLASALGFSNNTYFFGLINLDVKKTLDSHSSVSDDQYRWSTEFLKPEYKTDDFTATDSNFDVYLTQPYLYIFSVLTKSYWSAVPWSNETVKNIKLGKLADGSASPLVTTSNGRSLDEQNTNFDRLYGSGSQGTVLNNTWFAGPYYIETLTNNQMLYQLNADYFKAMPNLTESDPQWHVQSFLWQSSAQGIEILYQNYIAGEISSATVPTTQYTDAIRRYGNTDELKPAKTLSTSQSSYPVYTAAPYVIDGENAKVNNFITDGFAKLLYSTESKNATIFRAGLAGLINQVNLAKIIDASGDFNLASVPYGVFRYDPEAIKNVTNTTDTNGTSNTTDTNGTSNTTEPHKVEYYEHIAGLAKDKDNKLLSPIYGGLPRPYADYTGSNNTLDKSFDLYYYSWGTDNKYKQEKIPVDPNQLKNAISAFKGSGSFSFQFKSLEQGLGPKNQDYYTQYEKTINSLTNPSGLTFKMNYREGTNPTVNQWYTQNSADLGNLFWSPDYDGVGTWLEAFTTLESNSLGGYALATLFKHMIISAKELGADVSSTGAKVTTTTNSFNNNNTSADGDTIVYVDDPRIKAIWGSGSEWKFAMLAVNFLDYLIKQNVLDGDKIKALLDTGSTGDSSSLYGAIKKLSDIDQNDEAQQSPKTANDVRRYYEFFKKSGENVITSYTNQSAPTNADLFSTRLGAFAGLNDANAMFLTTAIDMDYLFLPFRAGGLKATSLTLLKPQFIQPTPVGVNVTYRDTLLRKPETTS